VSYKLILNKDHEELISEHDSLEAAFDAGAMRLNDGYILRVADHAGVVQYTQVLNNGRIEVYRGDATTASLAQESADTASNVGDVANALRNPLAAVIGGAVLLVLLGIAATYLNG
jgi:hypothetical protein